MNTKKELLIAEVEFVSLNRFLKLIASQKYDKDIFQYVYRIPNSYGIFNTGSNSDTQTESSYVRKTAFLYANNKELIKADIRNQAQYITPKVKSNQEVFEELALACVNDFINPTHIVCMGHRTYMAIDINNCKLITKDNNTLTVILEQPAYYTSISLTENQQIKRFGYSNQHIIDIVNGKDGSIKLSPHFSNYIIKQSGIVSI